MHLKTQLILPTESMKGGVNNAVKQCSKCKEWKDESEFHKDSHHKSGLKSYCKTCVKEISHADYLKNKARYLEGKRSWRTANPNIMHVEHEKRKLRNREFIDSLKTPCVKCGECRRYVIQFHHVDPSTKQFTLGEISSHGLRAFELESKKCICLCANCHFEFHYIFGNEPKHPVEALQEYLKGVVT